LIIIFKNRFNKINVFVVSNLKISSFLLLDVPTEEQPRIIPNEVQPQIIINEVQPQIIPNEVQPTPDPNEDAASIISEKSTTTSTMEKHSPRTSMLTQTCIRSLTFKRTFSPIIKDPGSSIMGGMS
jgi:hypothetical protein